MGLAYLGLGDVYYYNTKQYAEAANAYKQGLQYRPNNVTALYNLGWCYNDLERYADAVAELRKAVNLQPNYPEAYNEIGLCTPSTGPLWRSRAAVSDGDPAKNQLRFGTLQSRHVVPGAEQSQRRTGAVPDSATHRCGARDKTFQSH